MTEHPPKPVIVKETEERDQYVIELKRSTWFQEISYSYRRGSNRKREILKLDNRIISNSCYDDKISIYAANKCKNISYEIIDLKRKMRAPNPPILNTIQSTPEGILVKVTPHNQDKGLIIGYKYMLVDKSFKVLQKGTIEDENGQISLKVRGTLMVYSIKRCSQSELPNFLAIVYPVPYLPILSEPQSSNEGVFVKVEPQSEDKGSITGYSYQLLDENFKVVQNDTIKGENREIILKERGVLLKVYSMIGSKESESYSNVTVSKDLYPPCNPILSEPQSSNEGVFVKVEPQSEDKGSFTGYSYQLLDENFKVVQNDTIKGENGEIILKERGILLKVYSMIGSKESENYSNVTVSKDLYLLISAPFESKNGIINWCPYRQNTCSKLSIGYGTHNIVINDKDFANIGSALLGYSISSPGQNVPSSVTICAPRLTQFQFSLLYVTGGCFEWDPMQESSSLIQSTISTCTDIEGSVKSINLQTCTMGASIGYHEQLPKKLFLGGPYFYHGEGMGTILDLSSYQQTSTKVKSLDKYSLLGSSLDISNKLFVSTDNRSPFYVAYGAPGVPSESIASKKLGTGLVAIYPSEIGQPSVMHVALVHGRVFGSRFGHSLLLMDLNNDGWDDLIVGAPYELIKPAKGGQPHYGAVHVFLNQQSGYSSPVNDQQSNRPIFDYTPESFHQVIRPNTQPDQCGPRSDTTALLSSGFGSTLEKLGDINHDGYPDFAIGAPYAGGAGAVYVYHGSKSGKLLAPTQIICAKDLSSSRPLTGFGFSIGLKGMDLDANGYADVAIGAPLSDAAVILLTRPVIKIEAHLVLDSTKSNILPLDLNQLSDCTSDAHRQLNGYLAPTVRCADAKLFLTYSSVDGEACSSNLHGHQFEAALQLKLANLTETEEGLTQCGVGTMSDKSPVQPDWQSLLAPVSLFETGSSTSSPILDQNHDQLRFKLPVTCRNLPGSPGGEGSGLQMPTGQELANSKPVRVMFRDIRMISRLQPLKFDAEWVSEIPGPSSLSDDINQFPIDDPRQNKQTVEFQFQDSCSEERCCPKLSAYYSENIQTINNRPVVYIGTDQSQSIEVEVEVKNLQSSPIYAVNMITRFSSALLELDAKSSQAVSLEPGLAICHITSPLQHEASASCKVRLIVSAQQQIDIALGEIFVDSTVIVGSGSPARILGQNGSSIRIPIAYAVNMTVDGTIDPTVAYFSGKRISGITPKAPENKIGESRLSIDFEVRNMLKNNMVPNPRLIIDWPYEIVGDVNEPHGRYLLYLLEDPLFIQNPPTEVEIKSGTNTSVICDSRALSKLVNPHNYRVFPSLRKTTDGIPVHRAPVDLPKGHPQSYPELQSEFVLEKLRLTDDNSDQQNQWETTLSCYNGQVRCVPITCDLGRLTYKTGPIKVQFKARLWDSTLRQDFASIFLTKLDITATWRADVKYRTEIGELDHARDTVQLQIFNNLEAKPLRPKHMTLYIGLAVFGGLLLLTGLVLIMWKAGFFKRKRFQRRIKREADNKDKRQQNTNEEEQDDRSSQPPPSLPLLHGQHQQGGGTAATASHNQPQPVRRRNGGGRRSMEQQQSVPGASGDVPRRSGLRGSGGQYRQDL